ncbi:MAG: helix-turn-helix transcriptional regulator [Epulopiscium sp.]|nr:helix-turn-helix transcriptional regulator [Candidatus Epulonipiscium sp.]
MKLVLDGEERNIIGPRVKAARLKNKLTQKELSTKLETLAVYIDRASISKLEQQKRIIIDIELLALSQVLNVSVNWLLGLEKQ